MGYSIVLLKFTNPKSCLEESSSQTARSGPCVHQDNLRGCLSRREVSNDSSQIILFALVTSVILCLDVFSSEASGLRLFTPTEAVWWVDSVCRWEEEELS